MRLDLTIIYLHPLLNTPLSSHPSTPHPPMREPQASNHTNPLTFKFSKRLLRQLQFASVSPRKQLSAQASAVKVACYYTQSKHIVLAIPYQVATHAVDML
jgi:hypothetical protein